MNQILFISDLGSIELLIIIIIIFLFFGPNQIVTIARDLGQGIRKMKELIEDIKKGVTSDKIIHQNTNKHQKNIDKKNKKENKKIENTVKKNK